MFGVSIIQLEKIDKEKDKGQNCCKEYRSIP